MKKKKIVAITALATTVFASACGGSNASGTQIIGFDVPQEIIAELGSVFSINMPFVYDENGNFYDVTASVKYGNESIETVGGMFELDKVGSYDISFTINANGEKKEKITTVNVTDTVAPVVYFDGVFDSVIVGEKIDFSKITAADYSGVKEIKKEVFKNDVAIEFTDDSFIPEEKGFYVVKVTAEDNAGLKTEKEIKIEALEKNQIYTFNTGSGLAEFGSRYSSISQVEDAPDADGGCIKIVPTQGWFYITWKNIGNSSSYAWNLSDKQYKEYAYVSFDIYFETVSEKASFFDFNNAGTSIPSNQWVTVSLPKEKFNNGTLDYTAMWSATAATAVYIDNVRLEKISPIKYDFENGSGAGEFTSNQSDGISVVADPVNENNKVLLWKANKQWAALNFSNFNKEQLSSEHYAMFEDFTFKIYVKSEQETIGNLAVFGINKGAINTNEWITVNVSIQDVIDKATQKYIEVWDGTLTSFEIYLDDIGVTGEKELPTDPDQPVDPDKPDTPVTPEKPDNPPVEYKKGEIFNGQESECEFKSSSDTGEDELVIELKKPEEINSVVDCTGITGNIAMIADNGDKTWNTVYVPQNMRRDSILALDYIDEYEYVCFRMYSTENVSFFPYCDNAGNGKLNIPLKKGEWQLYKVAISAMKDGTVKANNYVCFWSGTAKYKVFISNVYLVKGEPGLEIDLDGETYKTVLTNAVSNSETSVIDDPTESGKEKVYQWKTTAGSYNANSSWTNISDAVAKAKTAGYTHLVADVYSSISKVSIHINGWNFTPTAANEWQTIKVDLGSAVDSNLMWADAACYVLIYDIHFEKLEKPAEFTMDYEGVSYKIELLGATGGGASTSVIDDPTESGRGKVYQWKGGSGGSYNTGASWTNIADLVAKAKDAGYDMLSIDIYRDSACGGTSIHINKWIFSQTKTGEWETITVSLNAAEETNTPNLMWMQNGGGYVLFDNFRFSKFDPIIFDGEKQDITLSSTHTSKPVIEVVESGEEAHGKVYSYSHTGSIYDQYVSISGIDALIKTAKLLGYTKLSIDVKYTSGNASIMLMGCNLKPLKANAWETKTISLDELKTASDTSGKTWLFWISEAGAILLDNITFVK